jgi:hypothetical protein
MNFTIKELNELIYSLGTTATKGMMCDKELNASLLDRLTNELSIKILSEAKEEVEENWSQYDFEDENGHYRGKYISNEEADEDAGVNQKFNGVSKFILDFVEANGAVSFTEMNDMYKAYTKGSNSFSHILKALRIPYKNRPTRRYLKKMANGAYTIAIATPQNWIVSNYDYRTFNEAPYGN